MSSWTFHMFDYPMSTLCQTSGLDIKLILSLASGVSLHGQPLGIQRQPPAPFMIYSELEPIAGHDILSCEGEENQEYD